MATSILSSSTPEQLAEQFPMTGRPFAVWYSDHPDVKESPWAVNERDGHSVEAFKAFADALKYAAKLSAESGWEAEARKQAQALANLSGSNDTKPSPEQMKIAFEQIATMANSLRDLCNSILAEDCGNQLPMAASSMAAQIGWIADRCIGFDVKDADSWFLPPVWERAESEAHHA